MSGITQNVAKNGHLETLQWLYTHFNVMGSMTGALAAQHSHMHVVRWVVGVMGEKKADCIMEYAAKHNHREMMQWLFKQGYSITSSMM